MFGYKLNEAKKYWKYFKIIIKLIPDNYCESWNQATALDEWGAQMNKKKTSSTRLSFLFSLNSYKRQGTWIIFTLRGRPTGKSAFSQTYLLTPLDTMAIVQKNTTEMTDYFLNSILAKKKIHTLSDIQKGILKSSRLFSLLWWVLCGSGVDNINSIIVIYSDWKW